MKILNLTMGILLLMTLTITSRQEVEAIVSKEDHQKSLYEILQSILSDPEFLAIETTRQLHVLLAIYDILENHYKEMTQRKTMKGNNKQN